MVRSRCKHYGTNVDDVVATGAASVGVVAVRVLDDVVTPAAAPAAMDCLHEINGQHSAGIQATYTVCVTGKPLALVLTTSTMDPPALYSIRRYLPVVILA